MLSPVSLQPVCLRQQVVDALEQKRIAYAVLHGWPASVPDDAGDLDLVVAPESLPLLAGALRRHFALLQILPYASTGSGFVIRPRGEGREQCLIVDCSSDYRCHGLVLFDSRELLGERRWCENHWLVSPRHELGYLLAKKICEKGCFPPPQRGRVRELVLALGSQAAEVGAALMGERWGAVACAGIRRQDWDRLGALIPRLRRAFFLRHLGKSPGMLIRYWLPEIGRLWRRWRRPTGMWVALLGPDGCGKTTLARSLEQHPPAGFRRTLRFHFRPRLWPAAAAPAEVSDPHGRAPRSRPASALKAVYYAALELLGYLLRLRPALARSALVISDRYYDDIFLDPLRYRMARPGRAARVMRRFVPCPDLYVVLLPAWQSIAGRKQEVSLSELQSQLAAYRRWAAANAAAVVVESEGGPGQLYRQVEEIINNLREQLAYRAAMRPHQLAAAGELLEITGEKAAGGAGGERYAVWSSGDGRRLLASLVSRRVAAQGLRLRNPQKPSARALAEVLRAGLRSGLAQPWLRRTAGPPPALLQWLQLVSGEERLHCSLAVGPAGPHQKCVLQLMRPDGGIFAYAKVGSSQPTIALVRAEAEFLRRLAALHFARLAVPELLFAGWFGPHFVALTRAPGEALAPAPPELTDLHFEALRELLGCRGVRQAAQAFPPVASGYYQELIARAHARAQHWLGGMRSPACLCHGDFTPWNLRLLGGRLLAFDWEYASEAGTPAYDLIHFFFHSRALGARGRIYAPALAHGPAWRALLRCLDRLGCGEFDPRALVLLYLCHRAAFLFRADERDSDVLRDLAAAMHVVMHK